MRRQKGEDRAWRGAIGLKFTIILMKLEMTPNTLRASHCHKTLLQTFSHWSLAPVLGKRCEVCTMFPSQKWKLKLREVE